MTNKIRNFSIIFLIYFALCEYKAYGNFLTAAFVPFLFINRANIDNFSTIRNLFSTQSNNAYFVLLIPYIFVALEHIYTFTNSTQYLMHSVAYALIIYNIKNIIEYNKTIPTPKEQNDKLFHLLNSKTEIN